MTFFLWIGRRVAVGPLLWLSFAIVVSSCSSTPRRAVIVPSVAPVREKIVEAKVGIAQARAVAVEVKLAISEGRPLDASAGVDQLTAHLLTADQALDAGVERLAGLQGEVKQLAIIANDNAMVAKAAEAVTAKIVRQRNWSLLTNAALFAWIFRKPLFALLALAGRVAITFFAPYLAPLTAFIRR